ncbi:MAG: ASCH domain-containing protein [Phycisphaerales bacterium]|nr:ASCH domain-containing protein [Phycisphaerales bacterium]
MLLFKRHLVELVRNGHKRQTIRLWSRPLLHKGQMTYTPGLGRIKITAVDQLQSLNALTEADAIADGFPTLQALLVEIHQIYGKPLPIDRHLYRIRFSWPIDAAGKTLIVQHPPLLSPQKKLKNKNQKLKIKNRKSRMTLRQRQVLCSYILARKPI